MSRRCGGCTLCCRLLPTKEINKPAVTRCPNQRTGKGCAIYADRPVSCRLWSCAWLIDEETRDLRRPDRSHYVIDPVPDFVEAEPSDGGPTVNIPVIQIWCDPAHRDAHRDPALRRYLTALGERGVAALIRFSSSEALTLMPPAMMANGEFLEVTPNTEAKREHSFAEVMQAIGGKVEVEL